MAHTEALLCPDCGKPIEVLKACGATNYFCNHCNELKSSKRVDAANQLKSQPEQPSVPQG